MGGVADVSEATLHILHTDDLHVLEVSFQFLRQQPLELVIGASAAR